jgi:putative copper resistance protein D
VNFWDGWVVTAKAVTYAATLGSAGGVFFLAYNHALLAAPDRLRIRRLIQILTIVGVLASGARIVLTAASMSGDAAGLGDSGLIRMIWNAGEGRATSARVLGLLFAACAIHLDRRPGILTLAAAGAAAASFAWVGHVHALAAALPVLLVSMHLLSVAFWLGAFGPLLLIARQDDPRRVAGPAARFGTAAVVVVGVLVIAGLSLGWILMGNPLQWPSSKYGRLLAVKLGLVAGLLGLAAFNKLRLTPRLLAGDARAVRSLRSSIRAEMGLAACILWVTACLTTLTGPPALE